MEFVRVSSFSVGIYVLEEGATDHQKPHTLDEVYYVAGGKANGAQPALQLDHRLAVNQRWHGFSSFD